MKKPIFIIAVLLYVFSSSYGCSSLFAENDPEIESITAEAKKMNLHVGDKTQIKVTAHYKN